MAFAGLKPFPVIARRALEMAGQPEPSMRKWCDVIEHDAALTARVLRVANSSLYRDRGQIRDIRDAVTCLGLRHVTEIIAALASMGLFADATGIGARFRGHGMAVGAIEYIIWRDPIADDALVKELVQSGDSAYLNLTLPWITAAWPQFVMAHQESPGSLD